MRVYLVMDYTYGQSSGEDYDQTSVLYAYLSKSKASQKIRRLAKNAGAEVEYDEGGYPSYTKRSRGDNWFGETVISIDLIDTED